MSVPVPDAVQYHEVTWTLGHAKNGTTTLAGARGRVRFEAAATAVAYSEATILPAPVETPVIAGFMTPVELLQSEPGIWNWKVSPSVGVQWAPFHVDVEGPVNLASAATTPGTGPVRVVKGDRGAQGASLVALEQVADDTLQGVIEDPLTGQTLVQEYALPRGPEGPYGGTVVTDPQIASMVADGGTSTRAALDAATIEATTQKTIWGGTVPKPIRAPVLTIDQTYPNARAPYRPCWVDGATIYAYGMDATLRKSTDNGRTWVKRGYNPWTFGTHSSFLKLASGTLLNLANTNPVFIQRSTDDGATWTRVHDWRTGTIPLGAQSWCVNPLNGHVFYGEYNTTSQAEIRLWRSVDDGLTWTTVGTWPGASAPVGTENRISHVHSVQWDPHMGRVVISLGDSTPATGLWRTTAGGTGVEPVVTNSMLPAEQFDTPRSIGIMPFPEYLVWASDASPNCYLNRMRRSEIGKSNPVVERVYRLNSTAWFTCKASNDGSRWVFSASQEGTHRIDNLVHLYAVEDEGSTVWEVGALPANTSVAASSLQPVGTPDQGDNFWLAGRLLNTGAFYKMRLGYGTTPLPSVPEVPDVQVPQTISAGQVLAVPPASTIVMGTPTAGGFARRFYILEASAGVVDAGGTVGNLRLIVRKRATGEIIYSTTNLSDRYSLREDFGASLANYLSTGGEVLEIAVQNLHAGQTITCAPSLTFGWGAA